ncbi:MAG: hypothetical protein FJ102_24320 [Deltaproteobacteria bacterium]|nr:hypothetical protein [Deltaproteobacteria bacterium]
MSQGFHVVFRAVDDRVLAPDDATRRALAGCLLRVGRTRGLFGLGAADTHAHALLAGNAATAGRFVHDARLSLPVVLGIPMAAASVKPLRDVWHAESALGYVHRQDTHHGVVADPYREATTLPDLLGLRLGHLWTAQRVREVVPRVSRASLLAHWGLDALVEGFDLDLLAEAGAAAAGVATLVGKSPRVVEVRRACIFAAAGESPSRVAEALGIATRTLRELRESPAAPLALRAVRLQMGLRLARPRVDPFVDDCIACERDPRAVGLPGGVSGG